MSEEDRPENSASVRSFTPNQGGCQYRFGHLTSPSGCFSIRFVSLIDPKTQIVRQKPHPVAEPFAESHL